MNNILNLLTKDNKRSKFDNLKYEVINCDESKIKHIKLEDIIQDKNDIKIFNSVFGKTPTIVKLGKSDTIEREFDISHILYNQPNNVKLYKHHEYLANYNYFIKYFCYFSCRNDLSNIISYSSICANKGDDLNILVMKKYELGNIKKYNWNEDNFDKLKELIKQIFYALYKSYINFGFIHNDVHFGNFLIKENFKVVIMDFGNSLFDYTKKDCIKVLYNNFKQIFDNIDYELKINTNLNLDNLLLNYISTNTIIDINLILDFIDNLIFIRKDEFKLQVYDPNKF